MSLYRQEVLDAQSKEWLGSIVIATPLSRWILSGLAATFVAVMLSILFFGKYTNRETISGQIVPTAGIIDISASTSGNITHLNVIDGQVVKSGDILLELSNEQSSASLNETHAAVRDELDIQLARLSSDLKNQHDITLGRSNAILQKKNSFDINYTSLRNRNCYKNSKFPEVRCCSTV